MASIKNNNIPKPFGGLAQTHKTSSKDAVESGHLVSPIAWSRSTRDLKRPRKPLDRRMGSSKGTGARHL